MAYPNPPMNIADSYTADRNLARINASATDLVWRMNKEATRKSELETHRLNKIGMEIFGPAVKKLGEEIAYITGGYLLDKAVQMRQLDVASDVQERLAGEALDAGPILNFNPGPDPDQAIDEVAERSSNNKGESFSETQGSVEIPATEDPNQGQAIGVGPESVSTEEGDVRPETQFSGDSYRTSTEEGDVKTGYTGDQSGVYRPPARGQSAQDNVAAARGRGASVGEGRPKRPRRDTHVNVGTTEIFVNPTTGGMYARTATGLAVPIGQGLLNTLVLQQHRNAETHLFNQTAEYEASLSRWADSLADEQIAANSGMSHALIDSHERSGQISAPIATALRSWASNGSTPEAVLKVLNTARRGNTSGAIDGVIAGTAGSHGSFATHYEGKADRHRTSASNIDAEIKKVLLVAADEGISDLANNDPRKKFLRDLVVERDRHLGLAEDAEIAGLVHGDLKHNTKQPTLGINSLRGSGKAALADLVFKNAGVPGANSEERREGVAQWLAKNPRKAVDLYKEWTNLHDQFGLGPVDRESAEYLFTQLQREGVDTSALQRMTDGREKALDEGFGGEEGAYTTSGQQQQTPQLSWVSQSLPEGHPGVHGITQGLLADPRSSMIVKEILEAPNIAAAREIADQHFPETGEMVTRYPEVVLRALAAMEMEIDIPKAAAKRSNTISDPSAIDWSPHIGQTNVLENRYASTDAD